MCRTGSGNKGSELLDDRRKIFGNEEKFGVRNFGTGRSYRQRDDRRMRGGRDRETALVAPEAGVKAVGCRAIGEEGSWPKLL